MENVMFILIRNMKWTMQLHVDMNTPRISAVEETSCVLAGEMATSSLLNEH